MVAGFQDVNSLVYLLKYEITLCVIEKHRHRMLSSMKSAVKNITQFNHRFRGGHNVTFVTALNISRL